MIDMKKIPVRIIKVTSPSGDTKIGIMLDSNHYFTMKEDTRTTIKNLEKEYFEVVRKAEKLFYKDGNKSKRQNLPSTIFWQLGNMLRRFYNKASHKFFITNYASALQRDFGLTEPYLREIIIFSKEFSLKDISDDISMAVYRALVWKRNQLDNLGLLEQEKQKLIKRGTTKEFIGRENYKRELKELIAQRLQSKNPSK